jgi:hypothetical protein
MTILETRTRSDTATTRGLLTCGVIAGPVFVAAAIAQILTRDGFDLRRHPLSLLSVGEHGWIQVTNFILAGILSILFSMGMARVLTDGPGSRWGPRFCALFGIGLVIGGIFKADPALGFPVGAPEGYPSHLTSHAMVHAFAPPLAFLSLIGGLLVIARRFAAEGLRRTAVLQPDCRRSLFGAERASRTRLQHPPLRRRRRGVRLCGWLCPLFAASAQGLIATRMSRRIEESTRCSKFR